MDKYERYQGLMADWAGEFMRPFARVGPPRPMPEASKAFLNKLFYGFTEISTAYEALELSQLLVRLAPPRSKRIKRDEYLKYHVNAYLQEVYILKERLNSYATVMNRCYRGTAQQTTFEERSDGLFDLVRLAFRGVVDTRGIHVHVQRFSDRDLDQLSSLSFLALFKEDFIEDAKFEYKWVSRKWSDRIKKNNQGTLSILNAYFEKMHDAVTTDGKVYVPENARPDVV